MLHSDPLSFRAVSVDHALPGLLDRLLQERTRGSRNGRMKEIGPVSITIEKPWLRYVTVAERKVSLPAQIAETMWVLAGRNDVEWLSHYLPRAKDFSDDGTTWRGGYGPSLRDFRGVDQLWHVVELLREDVETRRATISLYDPVRDTPAGLKDVPCNNWLSFRVGNDGRLHLNVATRSNDIVWGWSGINTFEWSALLAVVCALTGLAQGTIRYNITSLHLYERHFQKARRIVEANRGEHVPLEGVGLRFTSLGPGTTRRNFDAVLADWFRVEETIRKGLPGVDSFIRSHPDRLMQEWLRALRYWHQGCRPAPSNLLNLSLALSPAFKGGSAVEPEKTPETPFLDFVCQLHAEKDAVYGDSWCRRGEQVSILANIARKIDRLGKAGAGDTELDTAVDLLVYLVKYRLWLYDHVGGPVPVSSVPSGSFDSPKLSEGTRYVDQLLRSLGEPSGLPARDRQKDMASTLSEEFDRLMAEAQDGIPLRVARVTRMMHSAYAYAGAVWARKQLDEKRATQRFDGYALAGEGDSE